MVAITPANVILPNPEVAEKSVRELANAVLADGVAVVSSAKRTTWAAESVPEVVLIDLEARRTSLRAGGVVRGVVDSGFYQWYFTLLDAARQRDRDRVCATLMSGPGTADWTMWQATSVGLVPGTRMPVDQEGPRPRRAAEFFSRQYTALYREPVSCTPLDAARFADSEDGFNIVRRVSEAAMSLAVWWPEARGALDILTTAVTLLEGQYLIGGSDLACYGTTFLNLKPEWSIICFADHLVHEAAHQALHAVGELSPPLRNPEMRTGSSPIRTDPRPLYGTLHATVVFSWLVELCHKALDHGLDPAAQEECNARLHRHLLGFVEGCEALEKDAQWSEAGQDLWDGLQTRRWELLAALGSPDPYWYERIPEDYEPPSALRRRRS